MERGKIAAVVCLALVGSTLIACFGGDESKFDDSPKPVVSDPAPISPIVPETPASDGGADAALLSCSPAIPSTFTPEWIAPSKESACTPDDLAGYWEACLKNASDQKKCEAWTAAHATCTACVEAPNGSGPVQWHQDRLFYTMNVAGCIALEQEKADADSCGAAYNAAVQCNRASCDACFAKGGNFDVFRGCQTTSQQTGVCKSYEAIQGSVCAGIKDTGAKTLDCFRGTGEAAQDHFLRVEKLFCAN